MDAIAQDSTGRKMNDEEFERFCIANPDFRIERNSNLEILITLPNAPSTAAQQGEILRQLSDWNFQNKRGVVFNSSAGFTLPDDAILSADVSWMSNEQWNALSADEKEKFSHACPEFVIEVRSKNDTLNDLRMKMDVWIRNGAQVAWLIDLKRKTVSIYRPGRDPIETKEIKLIGDAPVEGFQLNLKSIY